MEPTAYLEMELEAYLEMEFEAGLLRCLDNILFQPLGGATRLLHLLHNLRKAKQFV